MPTRERFYDPLLQEEQQASPIRGFQVMIGGTYVLLDDIVTSLREYAQSLPDPAAGGLIHEVATWLQSGERSLPEMIQVPGPEESEPTAAPVQVPGPLDLRVDRVEVYPDDPTAVKPRWLARSCDSDGKILFVTNGSFDQDYVIQDAGQRWPGVDIHLLTHAGIDTVWEERDPGGIRSASSGHRRPSPNRLWV
jgi:hypothetical protein